MLSLTYPPHYHHPPLVFILCPLCTSTVSHVDFRLRFLHFLASPTMQERPQLHNLHPVPHKTPQLLPKHHSLFVMLYLQLSLRHELISHLQAISGNTSTGTSTTAASKRADKPRPPRKRVFDWLSFLAFVHHSALRDCTAANTTSGSASKHMSFQMKYNILKSKLKYFVYVRKCLHSDLSCVRLFSSLPFVC